MHSVFTHGIVRAFTLDVHPWYS